MIEFLNNIEDKEIKFAVIISRTNDGEGVLCKHKEKNTFEFPGGHREKSETILEAAKRELFEEIGAIQYDIEKIANVNIITSAINYRKYSNRRFKNYSKRRLFSWANRMGKRFKTCSAYST